MKSIYKAPTEQAAALALDAFKQKWEKKYTYIATIWERHWAYLITYFDYPEDIKKAMYTTNAIESLNMTLRVVLKNKRVFPTDQSALKALYLAMQRISKRWTMPISNWNAAINRFIIEFGTERMKILT